jgi:hypothetical protein
MLPALRLAPLVHLVRDLSLTLFAMLTATIIPQEATRGRSDPRLVHSVLLVWLLFSYV